MAVTPLWDNGHMASNSPGKHFRKGMTVAEFFARFLDDAAAEAWFVEMRWPDGVACPHCDYSNVQDGAKHPSQRYRCRGCGRRFSRRTGTVMANSNLGFRDWRIESLRSMFKRGYVGTYHHMSEAHTGRYVDEFVGRHNIRPLDTDQQMGAVAVGMVGKSLPYRRLVDA